MCSGSTAATSSSSGSPSTARHTVAPMRPAAPNTATLIIGSAYRRRRAPARGVQTATSASAGPTTANVREPGAEHPVDDPGDVVGGDRVDLLDHPVEARDLAHRELAAPDAVHAARRALQRQRQRPGEVALGATRAPGRRRRRRRPAGRARRARRRASRRPAPARWRSTPRASPSPRTRCGTRTPSTPGRASRGPPGRAASSCRHRAPGRRPRARSGRGRRAAGRGRRAPRATAPTGGRRRANRSASPASAPFRRGPAAGARRSAGRRSTTLRRPRRGRRSPPPRPRRSTAGSARRGRRRSRRA